LPASASEEKVKRPNTASWKKMSLQQAQQDS
jgi:hypothetical protein